ncbi:hypothetical protein [Actinokineospora sp. NPDC004072]
MIRTRTIRSAAGTRASWWLGGTAALLALVAGAALGRLTKDETVVAAPEMPMSNGVPVPGRHSLAGAATAAQNFQIAGFAVSSGALNGEAAATELLAAHADTQARHVLAAPVEQTESLHTRYAPVAAVVVSYTTEAAEVLVWGVAATSEVSGGRPAGIENWGRSTVTLVWEEDRWRVQSQRFEPGPWPVPADARLVEPAGDFGFRAQELRQPGWSYVAEP